MVYIENKKTDWFITYICNGQRLNKQEGREVLIPVQPCMTDETARRDSATVVHLAALYSRVAKNNPVLP
jgi:hypothetical protein